MVGARIITAAGIIIGDEILSGKVQDANAGTLVAHLWSHGVALRRLVTIGDDLEEIAREVRHCSDRFDWVFTSGGIGPTHDDRTVEGVARAFDCPVVRPLELERSVRAHMGGAMNEAALKMAEVPEGARLLDGGAFPVVTLRNIFMLPGVPEIFAEKLERVCQQFSGRPPAVQRLYLRTPETAVAADLAEAQRNHPQVKIGSYPLGDRDDYNLLITVEGDQADGVKQAVARLVELLPPRVIRRVGAGKPGDF